MHGLKTIIRNELLLLRRDPTPFAILFVMPALAMMLFTPALGAVLREQGYSDASGVELAMPGMAVIRQPGSCVPRLCHLSGTPVADMVAPACQPYATMGDTGWKDCRASVAGLRAAAGSSSISGSFL